MFNLNRSITKTLSSLILPIAFSSLCFSAPRLDGPVTVLTRSQEGQVIVAGSFLEGSLYQLNNDGLIRSDFVPFTSDANISSVLFQADQKILVGGFFNSTTGEPSCEGVHRVDINGNLDIAFCVALQKGFNGKVEALGVQGDQKIVVGGGFTFLNTTRQYGLTRLMEGGAIDQEFGAHVNSAFEPGTTVKSLAIQPDGKILVVGYFQKFFGKLCEGLGRFNADGSEDTEFSVTVSTVFFVGFTPQTEDSNQAGTDLVMTQVIVQPDGKILVAGELVAHDEKDQIYKVRLLRLMPNGSLDVDFIHQISKFKFEADINALALLPDGKIVVGCNKPFVCLNPDGSISQDSFHVARNSFLGGISSMVPLPDGKLLVGGYFTQYRGVRVPNLVRLNPDGTLDENFLVDSEP